MRPGSSRQKGKRGEREIVAALKPIFPEARRGYQYRDGAEVADVVNTGPWWVEAKLGNSHSPHAALKQAVLASAKSGLTPVAICRRDREEAIAVLRLGDFIKMITPKVET